MTTSDPSCPWTAALNSNYGWINIIGGSSGTGNGSVNYFAAINDEGQGARTATATVAGKTVTIIQAGM